MTVIHYLSALKMLIIIQKVKNNAMESIMILLNFGLHTLSFKNIMKQVIIL